MKIQNIKDAQDILDSYMELREKALPIAEAIAKLEGKPGQIDDEEITIEDGDLYANWETYCCGGSDYWQVRIPLEYLFDEDWQEKAQAEIQRREEAEAERKRVASEKAKKAAQEREHKKYLELKAKYEGGA